MSTDPIITCYEEIDWATWEPDDRATLLFVIRCGEILFIHKKRGLGAGKINGPGGRIEPGETPEQAAIRETEEELLITPFGIAKRGTLSFQFSDGYKLHCTVFTAEGFEGQPTETDEAIPVWRSLTDIPYERMWEDDEIWLPRMIAGENFEGWFLFDGDDMLGHQIEFSKAPAY